MKSRNFQTRLWISKFWIYCNNYSFYYFVLFADLYYFLFLGIFFISVYLYNFRYPVTVSFNFTAYDIIYISKKLPVSRFYSNTLKLNLFYTSPFWFPGHWGDRGIHLSAIKATKILCNVILQLIISRKLILSDNISLHVPLICWCQQFFL